MKSLSTLGLAALIAGACRVLAQDGSPVQRPGDFKEGYERADYVTQSQSLAARVGEPADLIAYVENPPLGLPPVPVPADNPASTTKIELGRKLFFDRRLSANNTISCAMCHVPEHGFTHNEIQTAIGIEGRSVRRNSPTIYNTAYLERLFHDGREFSLENQVWSPLLAVNEMGNLSIGAVIERIRKLSDYDGLFESSFGRGPGMETIGMALATYERTLVSADSPFDRWYYGNGEGALDADAKRGFELFQGKGRCASCHLVGPEFALFTDNGFHNTGVGYRASMQSPDRKTTVFVAPGQTVDVSVRDFAAVGRQIRNDLGLYEVTGRPRDRWSYRTPSLRNAALTAPYMHDGSIATLEEVVRFYSRGGIANEDLDELISPLGLTDREIHELVAFLNSLTGSNVSTLVADAFAAPIGGQ